jgi:transcriptional regulator with XRE-family HTH domain
LTVRIPSFNIYVIGISTATLKEVVTKPALTIPGAMPKKVKPSTPFAARLTALRLARGLTQTELADKIRSSQRAISSYETVLDFPPTPVVIELAKALGVSADELLGLKPPKKVQKVVDDDPDVRRLWKTFQLVLDLPERDRRAVVRLVHSLVRGKRDVAA